MPQQQWTEKEERQYEHIRHQAELHGMNHDRAQDAAARTVDNQRAQSGKSEAEFERARKRRS